MPPAEVPTMTHATPMKASGEWAAGSGGPRLSAPSAARVGLWVFMGVVSVLFALFINAYLVRRGHGDWLPLPEPWQLWLNTALLAASSVALQVARVGARRWRRRLLRGGLLAGGALAIAFLGGQWWAWQELLAGNHPFAANPANSFFYLLTALHGLHLLGGLGAWGLTTGRAWWAADPRRARPAVELCATYWHFLFAVWLVLFALLLLT